MLYMYIYLYCIEPESQFNVLQQQKIVLHDTVIVICNNHCRCVCWCSCWLMLWQASTTQPQAQFSVLDDINRKKMLHDTVIFICNNHRRCVSWSSCLLMPWQSSTTASSPSGASSQTMRAQRQWQQHTWACHAISY
jgi:hypothetical protein